LANEFFQYATLTLFKREDDNRTHISENLLFLVDKFYKYSDSISKDIISSLVSSLESGFPIPSLCISNEELKERATSVQEIMLAASITKSAILQKTVLKIFHDIIQDESSLLKRIDALIKKIDPIFYEFDLCILRSLQISEYVEFLSPPESLEKHTYIKNVSDQVQCGLYPILADEQIVSFLRNGELRIIPLIDIGQIGSTSLDIRLGTSFQVYHPNRSGVIDFTDAETVEEAEHNSFLIDLDLLGYFVLAPGQFILGHTMEYLRMPDNIAAEIEGRSSYARLGIEIHMTAGFVDPGFHGVLTLEIFNAGPNPIKLFPGLRVGQLRFFQCPVPNRPYGRNPHAKYKGMLAHRSSLHSGDYEISVYRDHLSATSNTESK
jgi:dCTP deaminase